MTSNQADRKRLSDSSAGLSRVDRTQNDDSGFSQYGRRGFLRSIGGVAVVGFLAGCISGGSGGNDATGRGSVDEWLADTSNYDSVEDMTGKKSVTVVVGAEGNSGSNAFAPAAIEISPETTVAWKWVNGYHNVVVTDGQFESGEPERNVTFEHTFETAGRHSTTALRTNRWA